MVCRTSAEDFLLQCDLVLWLRAQTALKITKISSIFSLLRDRVLAWAEAVNYSPPFVYCSFEVHLNFLKTVFDHSSCARTASSRLLGL